MSQEEEPKVQIAIVNDVDNNDKKVDEPSADKEKTDEPESTQKRAHADDDEDGSVDDDDESRRKRKRTDEDDENNDNKNNKEDKVVETIKVDREKTVPFLIRVFVKAGGHHRNDDFRPRLPVEDEVKIYTWMDATLREVTRLIRTEHELAKRRDVKFAYSSVYVDMRSGRFQQRKIGYLHAILPGFDEEKT